MSTRSLISVEQKDGSVKTVYCHFDGYPSHNGRMLEDNYKTLNKANELVSLGNISSLSESVNQTDFYGRDRNENDQGPETSSSIKQALKKDYSTEYHYVFSKGKWQVYCNLEGRDLISISEAIRNERN